MNEGREGLGLDNTTNKEKGSKYNIDQDKKMFYLRRVVSGMEDLKGDKKVIRGNEFEDNQKGVWRGWDTPKRNEFQEKVNQRAEKGLDVFEQLEEGKIGEVKESIDALKKVIKEAQDAVALKEHILKVYKSGKFTEYTEYNSDQN